MTTPFAGIAPPTVSIIPTTAAPGVIVSTGPTDPLGYFPVPQEATGNDTRSAGNLMAAIEGLTDRTNWLADHSIDLARGGDWSTWTATVTFGNVVNWAGVHNFDAEVDFQSIVKLSTGPNKTTGPTDVDQVYGANTEKAWGNISTNGSGGVTLNDGYNIKALTIINGGPGKILVVEMFEAMVNTSYAVQVTCGDGNIFYGYVYMTGITSTTKFWVFAAYPSVGGGGSLIWNTLDWSAVASTVAVRVSGRQS